MLRLSRRLAFIVGTVTPALETWRRWHELITLTIWWPAFLDDVLLGAFLVAGAGLTGRSPSGRQILIAAWGFMCGIAYGSLTFQLANLDAPDPSGFSPALVATVKAFGLLVGVVGGVSAIVNRPS